MKAWFRSGLVWVALFVLLVLLEPAIPYLLGQHFEIAEGPRLLSSREYALRFILDAALYSVVGVLAARFVANSARAGLFALSLGLAYVTFVEVWSGLWYYLVFHGHDSFIDRFFFAAPILAPVVFSTAACLVWHALVAARRRAV